MSADRDSLVEKVTDAMVDVVYGMPDGPLCRADYTKLADVAVTVVARDIAARISDAMAEEMAKQIVHEEEEP